MSYPLSMDLSQKQTPSLKQMQRLIMSPQMQQALQLLQTPLMELSALIETELEQNPVLETIQEDNTEDFEEGAIERQNAELNEELTVVPEKELTFNENDFKILLQIDEEFRDSFRENMPARSKSTEDDKLQTYLENSITADVSLFEHLMRQAAEVFSENDLKIAELIIGNLDENGFFFTPLREIAKLNHLDESLLLPILKKIQTFEPAGIGATNLQEALLIQLIRLGHQDTLAYEILEKHYQDLIHNRIPVIQKKLGCTLREIALAIKDDIAKLDLHPGTVFSKELVQTIIPDVTLEQEGDKLIVNVHDDIIPNFRINRKYLKMLEDVNLSLETKEFIRQKIMSAKWLMRNIHQRNTTIEKIATALAEMQKEFFLNPEGKLIPMTMKMVAEHLDLHESTIARAVASKYINSPRGVLPLRSFFTNAYTTQEGEISSQTVRDVLLDIIQKENKQKPLSDEAIAAEIKKRGINCARRTVAKYRAELNIGNAHQRKQF